LKNKRNEKINGKLSNIEISKGQSAIEKQVILVAVALFL